MRYSPFKDWLKYDIKKDYYYMQSKKSFNYNGRIVKTSNGVIPVMYEYESCYQSSPKRLNTIPLPVNLESIEYRKNIIRDKIVIFTVSIDMGLRAQNMLKRLSKSSKKNIQMT